ncbi:unnamed protein product [Parajaminaea phylloscopi]
MLSRVTPTVLRRISLHPCSVSRPWTAAKMSMSTSPSSSSQQRYEAVVLGGGWSGLITALRLAEAKHKVLVLEARPRLGGRAFTHTFDDSTKGSSQRTVELAKGDVDGPQQQQPSTTGSNAATAWWERAGTESVDFGSSWIHGYNEGNPAKGLCEELCIPVTVPEPPKAAGRIIAPNGRPLSAELSERISKNLDDAMGAAKAAATRGAELPSSDQSLASFLFADSSPLFEGLQGHEERQLATSYARMLHVPLGTTLEHVALRWTGFEQNFAGTDAAPQGGFSRVVQALADRIVRAGGTVRTGQEAVSIEKTGGGARLSTQQGQSFEADVVVSTVPLAVLKRGASSLFQPALSSRKLEVIERVNIGNLNKVLLVYDGPAWWQGGAEGVPSFTVLPSLTSQPDSKRVGDVIRSTTLLVSATASSPSSPSSKLLVMVGGPAAVQLEAFERNEVVQALHEYLSQSIADSSSSHSVQAPSHNFMSRWSGHRLTGGATTTPVVVGAEQTPLDFVELSRPEWDGTLQFAGEHTELNHRGSIAGAIVSGEREAARCIALLRKKRGDVKAKV